MKDVRNNLELGNRELGEVGTTSVGRSAYANQMDEVRRMLEETFGYEFCNHSREALKAEGRAYEEERDADSQFYAFLIVGIVGLFVLLGVIMAIHA